jgi:hypothetical protein
MTPLVPFPKAESQMLAKAQKLCMYMFPNLLNLFIVHKEWAIFILNLGCWNNLHFNKVLSEHLGSINRGKYFPGLSLYVHELYGRYKK